MREEAKAWRSWIVDVALPLWAQRGFDSGLGVFHERLTFEKQPVKSLNRRLMVQARQVATFCMAARDGLAPEALPCALETLEHVRTLYYRRDGAAGWVFSLYPDGSIAEAKRDLYAHAFILYAHAAAAAVAPEAIKAHLRREALRNLEEMEEIFAAPYGGYCDAIPETSSVRRQNPHMHFLEAMIALFEVFGDAVFLQTAQSLVNLACEKLIDPISGMLLEFFGPDWKPLKPWGQNNVEPGHLFEWSWLLEECLRLNIPVSADLRVVADRLFMQAWRYGVDHAGALVWDGLMEDGSVRERSVRIWPQTELMRVLWRRRSMNRLMEEEEQFLKRISQRFLCDSIPLAQAGGWIDWYDAQGRPLVDTIPASSFYHIYGAARCFVFEGEHYREM